MLRKIIINLINIFRGENCSFVTIFTIKIINIFRTHEIVSIRMFNIQFYSDVIFKMSRLYNEDKYVRKMCVEFGDGLIDNRKRLCEQKLDINTNIVEDDDKDEFSKKPQIFVDHLLKITDEGGRQFTESEIRDHVFTTISAVSLVH